MRKPVMLLLALTVTTAAHSQSALPASIYDPNALFPALPLLPAGNPYRTATGEPGPAYWQNRADYKIDASLDDQRQVINGTVHITYTNNSPKSLTYLWLQLDQNAFKPHSRGVDAHLFLDSSLLKTGNQFDGGYTIHSVTTAPSPKIAPVAAGYVVTDTRMQVHLATPLQPGGKTDLSIRYSYTIPPYFYNADFNVNRTDILPTPNGAIYSIAQWYPRMCVLDDIEGWNTLPYLGNGEFYLEYGDFNVNLTLPSAYIVEASGELTNPQEVLTSIQLQRWKAAHKSEQPIQIRTAQEVTQASSRPTTKTCTWKFHLRNARDFAWTASKSFIWEGIRINLPGGKSALGISVYPIASAQPQGWNRSCEFVKFTIEYFSKQWYPYPYPTAVNVASNLDGMEYPGIVFCSPSDTGNRLWEVVNHELGHTWFPMIVGSNERKYAWMDEGFNVFIDNIASENFNKGEFEGYASFGLPPAAYAGDSTVATVTRPDGIPGNLVFASQYLKTAYSLRLLRDHIVGAERFDTALRKYISDWAFHHPTPWDFFHSINNTIGEDLTWFWKQTFLENDQFDQAIANVRYTNNDVTKGANITIDNLQKAIMPLIVELTTISGKKERYTFPVEIWEVGHLYSFHVPTSEELQSVVVDPDKLFIDANRDNNSWKPRP